jgi:hypothetical protein
LSFRKVFKKILEGKIMRIEIIELKLIPLILFEPITEDEILSLIFKYGPYSFFINLETSIVYGIKPGEFKEIGKVIVLENGNLEIEE